ncbi:YbaB/EbfC family nucleoid-associated protein [Streptosporangium saharense]|uniref:DNA-binding protein YbaB n=1 Tax=Streptosporangium saharense TaxID=1706840 RepID=A0A7W7QSD6_9ACTN|nr:YbaB/EbfC family nucleoid-associated protein [Streptosporangium saharense]MBB4918664.1 DNA-binding protein YbaB [Streptosporangium saharense]
MFDSADFGLEDLERISRDAERQMLRLAEIEGELGEVRGTGTGADGLVGVTVGPSGRVEKIDLNPRVMRLDSHALAEELMRAVGAAEDDRERRTREILESAGLPDTPVNADDTSERMAVAYEFFANSVDAPDGRFERR